MKKIHWYSIVIAMIFAFVTVGSAIAVDFRVGTGTKKGVYTKAGKQLKVQTNGSDVNTIIVLGKGTKDNLKKMKNGELDGAFVQPEGLLDAGVDFEVVTLFHPEYVHLITLKDGPKSIKDFDPKKDTIAIGSNGGGTALTWANFIVQDPGYKPMATIPLSGARALAKLESGEITGILRVCGLKDGDIMRANKVKDKFKLSLVDDWDFNDKVAGKEIYEFVKIDDDVYPNLISGWSLKTIRMQTHLIASVSWMDAHPDEFEELYDAAAKAVPNVLKLVVND